MADTSYFADQMAEKAAKWDMLEEYRNLEIHLKTLSNEFQKIATAWAEAANVFRTLRGISFTVGDNEIVALNDHRNAAVLLRLPKQYVNYEAMGALISDHQKTQRRLAELEENLGNFLPRE